MPPATPCSGTGIRLRFSTFRFDQPRRRRPRTSLGREFSERRRWGRISRRPDRRQRGDVDEYVTTFFLPENVVQRGLAEGSLIEDVRLRDALCELARTRCAPSASPAERSNQRAHLPVTHDDAHLLGQGSTVSVRPPRAGARRKRGSAESTRPGVGGTVPDVAAPVPKHASAIQSTPLLEVHKPLRPVDCELVPRLVAETIDGANDAWPARVIVVTEENAA